MSVNYDHAWTPDPPLLAAMKEINFRSHGLIRYVEGRARPAR